MRERRRRCHLCPRRLERRRRAPRGREACRRRDRRSTVTGDALLNDPAAALGPFEGRQCAVRRRGRWRDAPNRGGGLRSRVSRRAPRRSPRGRWSLDEPLLNDELIRWRLASRWQEWRSRRCTRERLRHARHHVGGRGARCERGCRHLARAIVTRTERARTRIGSVAVLQLALEGLQQLPCPLLPWRQVGHVDGARGFLGLRARRVFELREAGTRAGTPLVRVVVVARIAGGRREALLDAQPALIGAAALLGGGHDAGRLAVAGGARRLQARQSGACLRATVLIVVDAFATQSALHRRPAAAQLRWASRLCRHDRGDGRGRLG